MTPSSATSNMTETLSINTLRLDERQQTKTMEGHRPGIKEHRLHVEDHEDQRKHVVADVELNPGTADGLHARFVGEIPFTRARFGRHDLVGDERQHGHRCCDQQEAQKGVVAGENEHGRR